MMAEATFPWTFRVQSISDARVAGVVARNLCAQVGFTHQACESIEIAVNELATNLVRHARGGLLELRWYSQTLEVSAVDAGPGFTDPEAQSRSELPRAFAGAGGSLGCGLPAVRRLMDELRIENRPNGGAVVRAFKRLRAQGTKRPSGI